MQVPKSVYQSIKAKLAAAKARKEKREDKASVLWAKQPKKRKTKTLRRILFDRLVEICREEVFLRCKIRNGGNCEIGIVCGGYGEGRVWYHCWPQVGGNGLKYDTRSHVASCRDCNAGEYGARQGNGARLKQYEARHKEIIGEELYNELDALHGQRQIKTHEAREMIEASRQRIEALRALKNKPVNMGPS